MPMNMKWFPGYNVIWKKSKAQKGIYNMLFFSVRKKGKYTYIQICLYLQEETHKEWARN